MSSRFHRATRIVGAVTAALASSALLTHSALARDLRVCSDPNNLPYSNDKGEGFENKIADLLATDLQAEVKYYWFAQRRGYVRNTLNAHNCDLIMGYPVGVDMLRTTRPYYESGYVFVQRADEKPITSFDDERLKTEKVGIQLTGNDGVNTPPAHELGDRGITANVHGYMVYGDYAQSTPLKDIVDGVAKGETDVAIVWGPQAAWLAAQEKVPLKVTPVADARSPFPMSFKIGMGVRKDDPDFLVEIQNAIDRHQSEIDAILTSYHVPRLSIPTQKAETTP